MVFNFKAFFRIILKSFFKYRGTDHRLTAKRLFILLLALVIFIPFEFLIWMGLYADELFFRRYRDVEVGQIVFIIGNPRSGTTFLHRLLARDEANYLSMKTWEIFLAPSIVARKVVQFVVRMARAVGTPIQHRLKRVNRFLQQGNPIHKLALNSPEEDDYLFIHNFSSQKVWSIAAIMDEARRYAYFDHEMPEADRERIMRYYRLCLKRHLFFWSGRRDRVYLAKDPNFSPMVDTLLEHFPGARFIYLARNPLDAVPSHISLKEFEWRLLGSPLKPYSSRDYVVQAAQHWYTYPLERLAQEPDDRYVVINFHDMVGNVRETVQEIYDRFDLPLSEEYDQILREETIRAREHTSEHEYDLQEMGLTREGMVETYRETYERFDFDPRGPIQKEE